jgi:ankyrin repeat protein
LLPVRQVLKTYYMADVLRSLFSGSPPDSPAARMSKALNENDASEVAKNAKELSRDQLNRSLRLAAVLGRGEAIISPLLRANADLHGDGYDRPPALHVAVNSKSEESALAILAFARASSLTADVVAEKDADGDTPLHISVMRNLRDLVHGLVAASPEVASIRNNAGRLPLHTALWDNRAELVELLWRHSDLDAPDCIGLTCRAIMANSAYRALLVRLTYCSPRTA